MTTLIFFREGLSGHYLKSLIYDSRTPMGFRVDPWYPGIYDSVRPFVRENCACVHPHLTNHKNLSQQFDLVLTIQVRKKIYHAIYNNFYKKYLIENPHLQDDFKNWHNNMAVWYDQTFYNIKEYYQLYQQDLVENTFSNVIEFDHLLEIDYIEHVFKHYYNKQLTCNMRRIVNTYAELQLQHNLSRDGQCMKDIISVLPDRVFQESPWFASYCIFKYETNNHLLENQRQWSIDSVTKPIDKEFLIAIADQYQQ